ncbi:hypothetical protein Trydic_g12970 [Trypoxylus dichotomus]
MKDVIECLRISTPYNSNEIPNFISDSRPDIPITSENACSCSDKKLLPPLINFSVGVRDANLNRYGCDPDISTSFDSVSSFKVSENIRNLFQRKTIKSVVLPKNAKNEETTDCHRNFRSRIYEGKFLLSKKEWEDITEGMALRKDMLSVLKITCNHVYLTIFIAVWTIVQSLIHIYGLMHIQWWRDCKINRESQYYYLEFLFANLACNDNKTYVAAKENTTSQHQTEWQSWVTNELDCLIFTYFILDAFWLVTAVGLLTGACCLIKGIWALVFYLPWIVTSSIILIFDIFCTIFFASNIPTFGTFFDWFNFIGITSQINALQNLEGDPIELVLGAVSIVMTFVAARAAIIWIANLVFLVIIVKLAIQQYRTKPATKKTKEIVKNTSLTRSNSQRIRDWHHFYDCTPNVADRTTLGNSNHCCNKTDADIISEAIYTLSKNTTSEAALTRKSLSFAEKIIGDNTSISDMDDNPSNYSFGSKESNSLEP